MHRFLSLVWRELVEWRLVLLGGLVVGWMPWLTTWMPMFSHHPAKELREGVAMFTAGLFLLGFLLVLGSSIVGRDLVEGRLRFFFARPVSAGTLWGAKLTAALLLLLGTVVLLFLPSADLLMDPLRDGFADENRPALPLMTATLDYYFAFSWQDLPRPLSFPWRLLSVMWALLLALAATHCFASILRLRSSWLILDLLFLGLLTALALLTYEHLLREQTLGPLVWLERAFLGLGPFAFLGAGWHQLSRGRGDPSRSHRSLSIALWPLLLILFLGANGWAHWVTGDTLEDLEKSTFVETAPAGPWMVAGGVTRGRAGKTTAFLLNTETERSVRLGGLDVVAWQLAFSGDGERIVWARCEDFQTTACELWTLHLGSEGEEPQPTGIPLEHDHANLSLNREGTLLALFQLQQVTIYELPSGRLVNAFRIEDVKASLHLENGNLRLYVLRETVDEDFHIAVLEYDPESGTLEQTGKLPNLITGYHVHHSSAVDTVLYWSHMPPKFALADGRTGEDLVVYQRHPQKAALLADGSSVLAFLDEDLDLAVLSAGGEERRSRSMEGVAGVVLGGEILPGRLVIGLKHFVPKTLREGFERRAFEEYGIKTPVGLADDDLGNRENWSIYLFDTSTGDLVEIAQGLIPLRPSKFFRRLQPRAPESILARLFRAEGQSVVLWDPETGEVRRLFGEDGE